MSLIIMIINDHFAYIDSLQKFSGLSVNFIVFFYKIKLLKL